MGVNLKECEKEMTQAMQRTLREDLELILGFFGFKVKEINKCKEQTL